MNIILATHKGSPVEYCFSVADDLAAIVKKGMYLYVDTARGPAIAHAVSSVFSGEAAEVIARKNGAREPLRSVVSYLLPEYQAAMEHDIMKRIEKALRPVLKKLVLEVFQEDGPGDDLPY